MLNIEKVGEHNKQTIVDSLRLDIVKHVFAFYDIQYDPEHTAMYAAFENNRLTGYVLTYTALDFPSVILECKSNTAESLLKYVKEKSFIMHTSQNLLPAVKNEFPEAKHYVENWMLVKKGEANFFKSERVRKLSTKEDAAKLAKLLSSRKDRPERALKKYEDWISKIILYGVFMENELVAYAGSFIQLPEVWMIGGVYTNPNYRGRGYATLATSAVTEEALKNSEAAALFVRSDNYPAVRAYEKIGYGKVDERVWIDVNTGLKP